MFTLFPNIETARNMEPFLSNGIHSLIYIFFGGGVVLFLFFFILNVRSKVNTYCSMKTVCDKNCYRSYKIGYVYI